MSERTARGWLTDVTKLRLPPSVLRVEQAVAAAGHPPQADVPVTPDIGQERRRTADNAGAFGSLPLAVRFCALTLAFCIASLRGVNADSAPWLAALALPEAAIRGRSLSTSKTSLLAVWWTAVAGIGVLFTGGDASPLLPCLPAASFIAGLVGGSYGAIVVNGVASAVLIAGQALPDPPVAELRHYFAAMSQWIALSLAVGLVGAWVATISASREFEHQARYAETYGLLEQLRAVTRGLPGSLDLTTTCEILLDACLRHCGAEKGAVLVGTDDAYLVPMAVLGTQRVPWRGPGSGPGPMRQAWETRQAVIDVRRPDVDGHRAGSALLVVPIVAPSRVRGLVALEARDPDAFTPRVTKAIIETVSANIIGVETAHLFEEVRSAVTVEERARLARDMHDGVAQDLAYIGFELDALRTKAAKIDRPLGDQAANLRAQVTSIIGDIRSSISDLKSTGSVERGLGSAIASYVRNAGTTGPMAVHLSLQEDSFRLPAETEVTLFRILQELTVVARDHANARNLWVSLLVNAPSVQLRVEHDGVDRMALKDPHSASARLVSVGGSLNIRNRSPRGVIAEAVIGEGRES
jgi:signal transduction histidine kinase